MDRRPASTAKVVNLALQGGGAHGAFTWGVLDRLLEENCLEFEGVSATSAGAANAVVTAHRLMAGGREGGRAALADFWRRISEMASLGPFHTLALDCAARKYGVDWTPAYFAFDALTRMFSPYQLNPLNYNPLRNVLETTVDFERLRATGVLKLFLSATNVRTGKIRVFSGNEITADAVLASACLPLLSQAVEIDGEAYWDGGYMGNPAMFPLIYECSSQDVVLIHVNPLTREDLPVTAGEILNRVNEISFNSSLMREMRAVAFVTGLIETGQVTDPSLKPIRIHAIEAEALMRDLGVGSKFNVAWDFLLHLRDVGRESADLWLAKNLSGVGQRSTIDIRNRFL